MNETTKKPRPPRRYVNMHGARRLTVGEADAVIRVVVEASTWVGAQKFKKMFTGRERRRVNTALRKVRAGIKAAEARPKGRFRGTAKQ